MSFLYARQRVVYEGEKKSKRGAVEGEKAKAFYSNFNAEGPSNIFFTFNFWQQLLRKKIIFKNFSLWAIKMLPNGNKLKL